MVWSPHTRYVLAFAWTGAIVFAISLVWFLYCYTVRFDAAPLASLGPAALVDTLLFTAFAFHHSLLARPGVKASLRRRIRPELERSLYTWVASVLFIAVCAWWWNLPGVLYRLTSGWRLLAFGLQLAGLVLTIRASQALDALDLAGVRPILRSAAGLQSPAHVPLKTGGLYGFVRHPLYFAWALFVFSTPDMTATRFLFAALSTGYLALAIKWEERSLLTTFGEEYEAYRKKVRWRMLPGVY